MNSNFIVQFGKNASLKLWLNTFRINTPSIILVCQLIYFNFRTYTREQKKWAKPILKLLLQEIMAFLRTFWN